jgi:hypothetical protein
MPQMNHYGHVAEMVEQSVTNFTLGDRELYSYKILPDIWVQSTLYRYQALDDGQGWGYKKVPSGVITESRGI